MARLTVAAPDFANGVPATLRHFFKAENGADGRSLNDYGRDVADIWSCLRARCISWSLSFSGAASGSSDLETLTFSQEYEGDVAYLAFVPSAPAGYTDHPEVALISGDGIYLIESASTGGGGPIGSVTWDTGSGPIGPADLNYTDGQMDMLGQPSISDGDVYFPLVLSLSILDVDSSARSFQVATDGTGPQVGTLTINVFNWRVGSGFVSATMPLYRESGYDDYSGITQTFDATLTPTANSYFLYGSEPDNSNPRWNSDGSINGTPGT